MNKRVVAAALLGLPLLGLASISHASAETNGQALHACVVQDGADHGISIGDEISVWDTYWNGDYDANSPIARCATKLHLMQYNPGHVPLGYGPVTPTNHGTSSNSQVV